MSNEDKTLVRLTSLQAEVFQLYVVENMKQADIAIKIYGDKRRQSDISKSLRLISKKLKVNLTERFSKKTGQDNYWVSVKAKWIERINEREAVDKLRANKLGI